MCFNYLLEKLQHYFDQMWKSPQIIESDRWTLYLR